MNDKKINAFMKDDGRLSVISNYLNLLRNKVLHQVAQDETQYIKNHLKNPNPTQFENATKQPMLKIKPMVDHLSHYLVNNDPNFRKYIQKMYI